ncbi:MAG: glycine zipper 2TM domain-containing protein [Limnohabitans sp.]
MKNTTQRSTLFACLIVTLTSLSLPAHAQEVGRVISSTPIIQQVAVPRQVCNNEQVVSGGQKSGAGAAMGAIAGGAIGNSMGQGSGRAAATMLGLFGGAILGDKVEGPGTPEVRNVQNCSQQMFYENRTMAYNVVYEFAGKQYTVQMPQDPGPTVRLQITPMAPATNTSYGNVPPLGSAPRF